MSLKTLPLTIQCSIGTSLGSRIVIDSNQLSLPYNTSNAFWFVIIDRSTLKVVVNVNSQDNQNLPQEVQPYINNPDYILILTTSALNSSNVPAGAFYNYLLSEGGCSELKKMEQIYATLNCSNWGLFCYTFVGIMDASGTPGYELFSYKNSTIMTMELIPIVTPAGTTYTVAPTG